jgi:alcohol dehydrogenase class IV
VITCEGGVKLAVNSAPLIADWAVLDASLTLGLPPHVTAATGIDAIVHAVEAYTSARLKNPLSDALAREALRLLSSNLLIVIEQPRNLEARSNMLLGAHLAGLAFSNAPVAGVHALAYPLGGLHHLPHGLTNALMLRHVLQHNLEAAREHYAELAEIIEPDCGAQGSQARAAMLIERLDELARTTGLPLRLRDHGVAFDEAPTLAREAMKQTRLLVNNPCEITESDAQRLYEAAW